MVGPSFKTGSNVELATKIFEEHGEFIKEVIHYKVKNAALADDLYQDFFLTLSTKSIPSDIKSIKGFLFHAIMKDIIDSVRRVVRYQENLKRYTEYRRTLHQPNTDNNAGNNADDARKAYQAIENHLSRREAQAIMLRYKYAHNSREAAKKMGIAPRSFHRYISVGLGKIRQTFATTERGSR
jgi:RNA polymerase sigma factor (sigma-70 family)